MKTHDSFKKSSLLLASLLGLSPLASAQSTGAASGSGSSASGSSSGNISGAANANDSGGMVSGPGLSGPPTDASGSADGSAHATLPSDGAPQPEQPGGLNPPNQPRTPGEPVEPSVPRQPGEPVNPGLPRKPGEPVDPALPRQPGTPVEPSLPRQPGVPDQPGLPRQPGQPDPRYPLPPRDPAGTLPSDGSTAAPSGLDVGINRDGTRTTMAPDARTEGSEAASSGWSGPGFDPDATGRRLQASTFTDRDEALRLAERSTTLGNDFVGSVERQSAALDADARSEVVESIRRAHEARTELGKSISRARAANQYRWNDAHREVNESYRDYTEALQRTRQTAVDGGITFDNQGNALLDTSRR